MPKIAQHRGPRPFTVGTVPVGRVVAVARELLDQPADELAHAAGISKYSLCRLERGLRGPTRGELPKLLALLGALATGEHGEEVAS